MARKAQPKVDDGVKLHRAYSGRLGHACPVCGTFARKLKLLRHKKGCKTR
jgi:hypothetical protein